MNSIDDLSLLYGAPIIFYDICSIIPVKLKDIADIGIEQFSQYCYVLTFNPKQVEQELDMSTFEYILKASNQNYEFERMIKKSFFFFIEEPVFILSDIEMIQIGDDNPKYLTKDNFEEFQNIIKRIICYDRGENNREYNLKSEGAKKLAKKFEASRKIIERVKSKRGESSGEIDLAVLISSVAARIPGLNMLNIWDMTYFAFIDQLLRMRVIEDYDTKIRARLAGAKIKDSEMEHWIRKIVDKK